MTQPAQKRVKTVDLDAINWNDVEFIKSLGSGSYGCTFEASYQGERYAIKVEKLTEATLENKEVEINRIISQDLQNPFKLYLYGSTRYDGVLKEEIQNKMHEKCHDLWDKWWNDEFKGTWQLTMMELGAVIDRKEIVAYLVENLDKAIFSLLYAVTRMHSLGIVHHDIRLANLVLKYATEPVIVNVNGEDFLIANAHEPILAVIDYGLATLYEFKSEYYDGFSHWYGPSPVKRLLETVKRGNDTDYITQTSAVDMWMIAILVLGLNGKFAKGYVNANLSKTLDLRKTKLAKMYGNEDLVYLVHMAFLSRQFNASGIDPLMLEYVDSRPNPYQYLEKVVEGFPQVKSMLQALLSWDEGEKLHYLETFAYFTYRIFRNIRMTGTINAAICDACGLKAAILQCADCNNGIYCSEECHDK